MTTQKQIIAEISKRYPGSRIQKGNRLHVRGNGEWHAYLIPHGTMFELVIYDNDFYDLTDQLEHKAANPQPTQEEVAGTCQLVNFWLKSQKSHLKLEFNDLFKQPKLTTTTRCRSVKTVGKCFQQFLDQSTQVFAKMRELLTKAANKRL